MFEGSFQEMADQDQQNAGTADERPNSTGETATFARRRVLQTGVGLVPVILTLRSKPLFGQIVNQGRKGNPPPASSTLSANQSQGIQGTGLQEQ
jgi:hypothetical protein